MQGCPSRWCERMRAIRSDERFDGERVTLRLLTLDDYTSAYVGWLQDPEVNQYLETRWSPQTFETVRDFIGSMVDSPHSYLFAILDRSDHKHVGNIKVGPINSKHLHADVSYFIGERDRWGRGLATDAIKVITRLAFERLGLHRVQAGVYGAN